MRAQLVTALASVCVLCGRAGAADADANPAPLRFAVDCNGNRPVPVITARDHCAWPNLKLLKDGLIIEDEALKYCTNPNEFQLHLRGINASSDRTWAPVEAGQLQAESKASTYGTQSIESVEVPARPLGTAAKTGGLPSWMSKE